MSKTAENVKHAYIISRKGYCGGRPIIAGTKFPVSSVVNYILKQGMTPEELVKEFPHLNLSQIYDALSYYYDHKEEMDKDIENGSEISLSKDLGVKNG